MGKKKYKRQFAKMGKRITILTKKGAIIMESRLGEILYYTTQIVNQFPNMPQELLENGGLEIIISYGSSGS